MKKKIAIIGGGGFGQEVYCIWKTQLESESIDFDFIGFFDDTEGLAANNFGKIVGKVDDLNTIDYPLEVAIGIGTPKHIYSVKNRIHNDFLTFPNIIHPSVVFLGRDSISFGQGNILSANVLVSCNTSIGDFNILNTRATLGHDDTVGNFNVFSPNVQISGTVTIGDTNFFGFNSGILQKKNIGNGNTIGAGCILFRGIKDESTYLGVPGVKFKL
jgi:sugar O-acyltransferase (sialic acid O-acetyltransferase NeuD family)